MLQRVNDLEKSRLVVYSIDKKYLWPFLISLYSAHVSALKPVGYILALNPDALSINESQFIERFANVLEIDLRIRELPDIGYIPTVNHVTAAAYNKLKVPELLDKKFLWLDSDTFCSAGWDEVFDIEISETFILAARVAPLSALQNDSINMAKILAKNRYFNSGVMLIESRRFLEKNLHKTWIDVVGKRQELCFEFNDQDVWNYIISGELTELPTTFNFYADGRDGLETGRIVHFLGPKKPWHYSLIQREFLKLLSVIDQSSKIHSHLTSEMNMRCFELYWSLENDLLHDLCARDWELYGQAIQVRKFSYHNHFNRRLNLKVILISKIMSLLSKSIASR